MNVSGPGPLRGAARASGKTSRADRRRAPLEADRVEVRNLVDTARSAPEIRPEEVERARERLESDYYKQRRVLRRTARRLAESGDLEQAYPWRAE